jgi:lysine biosynthesis protein LysW
MATCPECDADVEVDEFDVDKGDQISCPECGSSLEVTGLSPVELDLAPDDDEDDEDEEELDEEEDDDEEDLDEEEDEPGDVDE